MNPLDYVKIGVVCFSLFLSGYAGYSIEASRFDSYKAKQVMETKAMEEQHQKATDQIRKEKDEQIAAINNQLFDAISQLHNRPNRAQDASHGQDGTGRALSAEDAEFLIREAARADQIRVALSACYKQYDE